MLFSTMLMWVSALRGHGGSKKFDQNFKRFWQSSFDDCGSSILPQTVVIWALLLKYIVFEISENADFWRWLWFAWVFLVCCRTYQIRFVRMKREFRGGVRKNLGLCYPALCVDGHVGQQVISTSNSGVGALRVSCTLSIYVFSLLQSNSSGPHE